MKMIDFKPYVRYLIMAGVVLILGSILINKACRSPYETKEYLELKGQFEGYKAEIQEDQKIKEEVYKEIEIQIHSLKQKNKKLQEEKLKALDRQIDIEKDLKASSQKIKDLKEKEKDLTESKDIIKNLREREKEHERRFSLAMADIAEERRARLAAEAQIVNLLDESKKKDLVIIDLQDSLRKRDGALKLCEDMVKKGEEGSFWKKTESVLVYGFAIYGAVEAGKKVFK